MIAVNCISGCAVWHRLALCLALSGFLVTPGRVRADDGAESPQLLRYRYGLGGSIRAARPGTWNWFTATISNPQERTAEVKMIIRIAAEETTGRFNLSKMFTIPAQADLRVGFPVRLPSGAEDKDIPRYEIELLFGGQRVDYRRSLLRFATYRSHVIGIIGTELRLRDVIAMQMLHPKRPTEHKTVVFELTEERVPDDPLGFDQLQTLIVVDSGLRRLRAAQWRAIEQWVQGGGNLIVLAERELAAANRAELEALLPVEIVGSREVTLLPSLAEWSGFELRSRTPFRIHEVERLRGQTLLWNESSPLVVRAAHGLGSTCFVAIASDPMLVPNYAYRRFWLRLLEETPDPPVLATKRLDRDVSEVVHAFAGRRVAGIWLPLTVIGGYLATMAFLLRSTVRRDRVAGVWTRVMAASAAFSAGAYGVAVSLEPEKSDSIYDLWVGYSSASSERRRLHDYITLLPAQRGQQSILVNEAGVRAVPAEDSQASVTEADLQPAATVVRVHADTGQPRTVLFNGQNSGRALQARGQVGRKGIELQLKNATDRRLVASFVRMGRRGLSVGELAPNESRTVQLAPMQRPSFPEDFAQSTPLDDSAQLRTSLLAKLFVEPSSFDRPLILEGLSVQDGFGTRPLWAGWIDAPATKLTWLRENRSLAADELSVRALGLLGVVPDFEVVEEEFVVCGGVMDFAIRSRGTAAYYYGKTTFKGERPVNETSFVLSYRLPRWSRPARIKEAHLLVHFEGTDFRLKARAGQQFIEMPAQPSGRYAIPGVEARVDSDAVTLHVSVEPREATNNQQVWTGAQWYLPLIEVECVCERTVEAGRRFPITVPKDKKQ